jgi:hypothetical protein
MKRPVTAGYEGLTSQFENNNERRADTKKENEKKKKMRKMNYVIMR